MTNPSTRILFLLTSLGMPAFAQAPPFDAGKALQETKPPQAQPPKKAPEPVIVQQEEKPLALAEGETLMVKDFRFEGAEFIPERELQAAVASYKGRTLAMSDIEGAAGRITTLYRQRGYLVAQTYVPRQDARAGVLTLRVLVGHYGKVTLKNQSKVCDRQIQGTFADLGPRKAVSREELERRMLLVSDLPGASLPKLTVSAGEQPGSSDFAVEVPPGKPWSAYLMGDNFGSRYTGKDRLSLGGSLNSPLHFGDQLSFSGMVTQAHELINGRLAYGVPLGSQGLRGELALSRTKYQLGDTYSVLDAVGRADSLEATFSYPILRSRADNLSVSLNLADRLMRDELRAVGQVTPKRLYAGNLGATYEHYGRLLGRDAYGSANLLYTHGHLKITDPGELEKNVAGADTVGNYDKASLTLAGRLALTQKLSASGSLGLQKSLGRNLDSSEQLMISGTRGVMAYEQSMSGDNGYLANAELRYALPGVFGITHAVGISGDMGRIYVQRNYTTDNGVRLNDAGINYTASWKMVFLRAQFIRALGAWPPAAGTEDRNRFLVQGGVSF